MSEKIGVRCCCTSQGGGVNDEGCPIHEGTQDVRWFNEQYPVGTPVEFWPGLMQGEPQTGYTRSAAWLLGGHTPVVMVTGYPGGIALTHVDPTTPPASDTTP